MREPCCDELWKTLDLDQSTTPTIIVEPTGRIVRFNSAFAQSCEKSADALQNIAVTELLPDHDQVEFSEQLHDIAASAPAKQHLNGQLIKNDGSLVSATIVGVKVQDPDSRQSLVMIELLDENFAKSLSPDGDRWQLALENAGQGVWDSNLVTGEMRYSDTWKTMRGHDPNADMAQIGEFETRVHPHDLGRVLKEIEMQDAGNFAKRGFEYRERHADGHWMWVLARGQVVTLDASGKPSRVMGTDTDITDIHNSQSALLSASRRLQLAMDVSGAGVWELNLETGSSYWDQALFDLFEVSGDTNQPIKDHIFFNMIHPEDSQRVKEAFDQVVENKTKADVEFRVITPRGQIKHIQSSSLYHVDDDDVPKVLGVDRDITGATINAQQLRNTASELHSAHLRAQQKNAELVSAHELVEHHSLHDELTGLPNRRYLDRKLQSHERTKNVAMLHIDLDRFKQINDTMGHAAGDAVLVHVGKILRANTAADDFVARVGGDEFVIFVAESTSDQGLASLAARIVDLFSEPYDHEGHECRFGVSIGIARQSAETSKMDHLLINADIAMYRAKNRGRNRYEFFSAALQTEVQINKKRADELLVGLDDNQFIVYYQPQFDAISGDIVCVEALARWQHPIDGLLFPDAFLDIAKDLNVVDLIDHNSFQTSVRDYAKWEGMGLSIPQISINVSAQRLRDDGLIQLLEQTPFRKDTLSFELLESIFLNCEDDVATWNIDRLKEMGIAIDVDDFGSGHASILGLLEVKPSRLKIDRQLIKPMVSSNQRRDLVRSIIEIGKSLGIKVVAEGVETAAHVEILCELGCDVLQGFYFAPPMSAADLEQFVHDQRWRRAS